MFLTCVKSQEVKLLVSPPKLASGNCWPENMFRHRVSAGKNTKLDLARTTVLGSWFRCAENTRFVEHTRNTEFLQQFLEEQVLDQSLKIKSWKFLTNVDLKLQFHHPMIMNRHLVLWFPEGRVGSWMKSIFLMLYSDPVRNYSLKRQRSEGRESCEEQTDTSIQETGLIRVSSKSSNKETSSITLSIPPTQESIYTKRTISANERKWKAIHALSPDGETWQ